MSLAPIATTQQIYNAGDLMAVIDADLRDRGIPCVVEIGEWDPEMFRGGPRCMILFADGTIGEPAGHWFPGMWFPVPDSPDHVAAPLLDDVQGYVLKIHAPAAPSIDRGAVESQRATDQLKRQVLAAIRRKMAAPLRGQIRQRWPKTIEGYPAFVYGSMVEVSLTIASPILDDKRLLETATQTETTTTFVFSDGTETPPVTIPVS